MIFFFFVLFSYVLRNWLLSLMVTAVLFLKRGVPPFHVWQVVLLKSSRMTALLVVITFQKLIPFYLIRLLLRSFLGVGVLLSAVIGPALMVYQKELKVLIIASSIYINSWFILRMWYTRFSWLNFWFVYLSWFILRLVLLDRKTESVFKGPGVLRTLGPRKRLMTYLVIFGLMGLPPFPGFLVKLKVLLSLGDLIFSFRLPFLLLGALVAVFRYLSFLIDHLTLSHGRFLVPLFSQEKSIKTIFFLMSGLARIGMGVI